MHQDHEEDRILGTIVLTEGQVKEGEYIQGTYQTPLGP